VAEMDCNEAAVLITALVDGELDLDDVRRIQAHLDRCEDCARRRGMEERLKAFLHDRLGRVSTPSDLKARVRRALDELEAGPVPPGAGPGRNPGPNPGPGPRPRPRPAPRRARGSAGRAGGGRPWLPLAILSGLLVAMVALLVVMEGGGGREPADDLLDPLSQIHWAATEAGIFQVRTQDAGELTAWLAARTGPYAKVPPLDAVGLTATGGRVVHMGPRTLAMALYRDYGSHTPDVTLLEGGADFAWPPDAGTVVDVNGHTARLLRYRGMGLSAFGRDGVTCVLISFRDPAAMRELTAAFLAALEGMPGPGNG